MTTTTFLYLAFGKNTTNHSMAWFSFLTLKKLAPANSRFVIYTDRPEFYKGLAPMMETRMMTEATLNEWQGKHNFLWRIKIMAMLDSAQKDPGHLIYLDTDTFALKDVTPMIAKLELGTCFMHVKESLLSVDRAPNKKLMWSQTQNKKFGGMLVDEYSAMWNAGVVAMNADSKVSLLAKALQSTDEMCEQKVEQWLIEQFSLSQALSSTGKIEASDEWIAHYWGHKKEFIQKIESLLSTAFQKKLSIDDIETLIDVNVWTRIMVPAPKKTFFQKLFGSN
jgi:hypothetical protein